MTNPIRAFGLLAITLLLSSCVQSACQPGPYLEARTLPPLTVPEGMNVPERQAALRIPDSGAASGQPAVGADGCVIEPPSFYADAGDPNPEGLPIRPGSSTEKADASVAPASRLSRDVAGFLQEWAAAWTRRDVDAWLSFYSPEFAPEGFAGPEEWREDQRRRFEMPARTRVDAESVTVEGRPDGRSTVRFTQHFGEAPDERSLVKEIVLAPRVTGTRWRIVNERIVEIL